MDIRIGDITKPETLVGCFDGVETVYHLAAVLIVYDPSLFQKINVVGTRNVIDASIKAGVKHFILVSSASVTYQHTTPYSLSKRETERLIKAQTAMKWTIVRPTLAYNENGGEEFNMFLAYLKKYPFVPFIGAGRALKRPVHCDDLMNGFFAIAGNPKSLWQDLRVQRRRSDPHPRHGQAHAQACEQEKPFVTIPIPICRLIAFFAESFRRSRS